MNSAAGIIRLGIYDTIALVPVSSFPAGDYLIKSATYSNSILSTLWVKEIDPGAEILCRWYDIGPGSGSMPGEKIYIAAHKLISTSDTSDRRLVSGIHNKAFLEISITGGNATFGVYITAVSSFPQEAPFREGQEALLTTDAGSAIAVYDEAENKYYFLRGDNGKLEVIVSGGTLSPSVTPNIDNYTILLANTEYFYDFPTNTKEFIIQNTGTVLIRLSYNVGESGTKYWSLYPGQIFEKKNIERANTRIYFQAIKANQRLELMSWS
jgi:hypothetical protein